MRNDGESGNEADRQVCGSPGVAVFRPFLFGLDWFDVFTMSSLEVGKECLHAGRGYAVGGKLTGRCDRK